MTLPPQDRREAIHTALLRIAKNCDGANALDGRGFNKLDTSIGKSLARQSWPFSPGQTDLAKGLVHKYRKQVSESLLEEIFNVG